MTEFWLCFVPLFVAVDAIGVLPMYRGLVEGVEKPRLRRLILSSVGTALLVALAFVGMGKTILKFVGITIADFMVAGGILLFILSLSDLLSDDKPQRRVDPEDLGAVPLGVPLIVGPAVLTTGMLLADEHGIVMTAAAVAVNVLIAGVLLWFSEGIHRVIGKAGEKILSKLANLMMAAIGVMIVRKGMMAFFE